MRARIIALAAVVAAGLLVATGKAAHALDAAQFAVADFGYDQGWRDESFDARHPRRVADITGDGLDDIVGFGNEGVYVSVARGDGTFGPANCVLAAFGYNQGWRLDPDVNDTQYGYLRDGLHPRFVVDVTADGRADIVGFGDDAVYVAVSRGDGTFDAPKVAVGDFGARAAGGDWWMWHPRVLAEVTGDQQPDIVAFRDDRVWVAAGRPDGTFASKKVALLSEDFGDSDLSMHDDFLQYLRDVNADDHADLVMVGKSKVFVALSQRSPLVPFAHPYVAADFGSDSMKRIRVVDVTGDKRAEILGAYAAVNNGGGPYFFKGLHVSSISPANGRYSTPQHAGADLFYPDAGHHTVPTDLTWAVGDVNGDGLTDVLGSKDCDTCRAAYVAYSLGDGTFGEPEAVLDDFGPGASWIQGRHLRLTGHITRDPNADIIGFGNPGVFVGIFRPAMDLVQRTQLAAARSADGTLEMYGVNSAGQVFASRHTGPGRTWSEWNQHDGVLTSLAAETNTDGRVQMFGVDAAGQVWSKWQTGPDRSWTTWGLLDGGLVSVAVARNADGRLALFGVNGSGQVWYRQQASPGGTMAGWSQLDGSMRAVAAETNADGRVELFAIGAAGGTFHRWQTGPGGTWSSWVEIPGMWLSQLAVARDGAGRLELFGPDYLGRVWHSQQTTAGAGTWAALSPFDSPATDYVRSVAAETNTDGRVDVYALTNAGKRFTRFQGTSGADWSGWSEIAGGTMTAVPRTVPDLRGLRVPEAADRLRIAGFFVVGQVTAVVDPTCNNLGVVVSQSPARNTLAAVGSPVRLSIGQRPPPPRQCN